jgi:hypothetical protein
LQLPSRKDRARRLNAPTAGSHRAIHGIDNHFDDFSVRRCDGDPEDDLVALDFELSRCPASALLSAARSAGPV